MQTQRTQKQLLCSRRACTRTPRRTFARNSHIYMRMLIIWVWPLLQRSIETHGIRKRFGISMQASACAHLAGHTCSTGAMIQHSPYIRGGGCAVVHGVVFTRHPRGDVAGLELVLALHSAGAPSDKVQCSRGIQRETGRWFTCQVQTK